MAKFAQIEKTLPLISNMLLPAFVFAFTLLSFYISGSFSETTNTVLHICFYLISLTSALTLLYFNQNKPIFFFLVIIASYIFINLLKHTYNTEYTSSPAYLNLSILSPFCLLLLYFIPEQPLLRRNNIWILLGLFIVFSIGENLAKYNIGLDIPNSSQSKLNIIAIVCYTSLLLCPFINAIRNGSISDYNYFFAFLCQMLAFIYSDTPSGLVSFSLAAVICLLSALTQNIYNSIYKDQLTGLDSRNSYIMHTKHLPLKYSLGIISIDDYDKIGTNFGRRIRNTLTKLIANQIIDLEPDENIYRYTPDEFVIVYKNLDKKEGFERLETIRRAIASSQFQYSQRRKAIKLTVSACIAEKKRSDANSFEVLVRADKLLQKTRAFSHNVTSKA